MDAPRLEVDDVPVCHRVVLALLPVLARCLDRVLRAQLVQLVVVHHLGTDEPLFKVCVDGASSLLVRVLVEVWCGERWVRGGVNTAGEG